MIQQISCARCGTTIDAGARYCARCGADISGLQEQAATEMMGAQLTPTAQIQQSILDALRDKTLGEYDILAELGRGGMATVFLAHDIQLDRKVAIKVMSPALLEGEGMVERFKLEARTAASLSHPNIIPIHAVGETEQLLYFVMKFVEGRSLESIIKEVGRLPIPMVRSILTNVGDALGYAHRRGIIHRDIKPGNIMIDTEGTAVVTDFGIAKVEEQGGLTRTGATVGTPSYMSPEQCAAQKISGASDQYSLGVVAYEMLTGKLPFDAETIVSIMFKHVHEPPPPFAQTRPDCPPELHNAVMRMLEKDPADRWPTMEAASAAIGSEALAYDDPVRTQMIDLAREGEGITILKRMSTPRSPMPVARSAAPGTPAAQMASAAGAASRGRPLPHARSIAAWGLAAVALAGLATAVWLQPWRSPAVQESPGSPPAAAGAAGSPAEVARVAALQIDPAANALVVGQAVQLNATASDASGNPVPGADLVWASDNPAVASVSPTGVVSALAAGVATVTVRSGSRSAMAAIQVTGAPPSVAARPARAAVAALSIPTVPEPVPVGDAVQLQSVALDADGATLTGRPVTWVSSDPSVAQVSAGGLVSGVRPGATTITATSEGVSVRITVTVVPEAVASVTISPPPAPLSAGASVQVAATPTSARGTALAGRPVRWSSSNESVATVSGTGVVTAIAPGTATITGESEGRTGSVTVTVTALAVAAADPRLEIETVIAEYARAIESLDVTQLQRVYPGITNEQRRGWEALFRSARNLRAKLTVQQLDIAGTTAEGTVTGTYDFENSTTGRAEHHAVTFRATLERGRTGWRLVSVH
jgi:serine/threonine-protein kinase